jgi:hypothetical protein
MIVCTTERSQKRVRGKGSKGRPREKREEGEAEEN